MKYMLWGAPGAGKTTLANMVAEMFQVRKLSEFATEWRAQHGGNGHEEWLRAGPDIQVIFGREQLRREQEAVAPWVTDSPAGLSLFYALLHPGGTVEDREAAIAATKSIFAQSANDQFTKHYFLPLEFVSDPKEFAPVSWQSPDSEVDLQGKLLRLLFSYKVQFKVLYGTSEQRKIQLAKDLIYDLD